MAVVGVSAIISAYYAEEYLAGRIENLLDQDPQPEVVVVAKYPSVEYDIAIGYPVLRVRTTDIPTIYAAWNAGIGGSKGKYITNANSDDRLYPGALAHLANLLDTYPQAGIAYGNMDMVTTVDGLPVGRYEFAEGGFDLLRKTCFVGAMPMWRRSLHDELGLFDASLLSAGDYEFWLRTANAGHELVHTKRTIGTYLNRANSAEHRQSMRSIWESARVRARYAGHSDGYDYL